MGLYLVVPINTIADATVELTRVGNFHSGYLRFALLWAIVAVSLPRLRVTRVTVLVISFLLYLVPLVLLSANPSQSIKGYQQFAVALLMLPIAFTYIQSIEHLRDVMKSVMVGVYINVLGWLAYQSLGLGSAVYVDEGIHTFLGNGQYAKFLVYALLLTPLLVYVSDMRISVVDGIALTAALVIVLLGYHRTSLLALGAGVGVLVMFGYGRIRFMLYGLAAAVSASVFLFVIAPRYGNLLIYLWGRREISADEVAGSARARETEFVLETMANSRPIELLFGYGPFNSRGIIESLTAGQWSRSVHVDFSNMLLGAGVVGLTLYLWIFLTCVVMLVRQTRPIRSTQFGKAVRASMWALMASAFFISIGTQLWSVTALSMLFLSLGALLGVSRASCIAALKNSGTQDRPRVSTGGLSELRVEDASI